MLNKQGILIIKEVTWQVRRNLHMFKPTTVRSQRRLFFGTRKPHVFWTLLGFKNVTRNVYILYCNVFVNINMNSISVYPINP